MSKESDISVEWLLSKGFKKVPGGSSSNYYVHMRICVIEDNSKFEVGLFDRSPYGEISLNPHLPHIDSRARLVILSFCINGEYL